MTTKTAPINWLDWSINIGVPSVVFAVYALYQGVTLPSMRVLWLGVPLGVVLIVLNRLTVYLMSRSNLQSEVLLQTLLRVVLSVGLAIVYGAAVL